MCVTDPEITSSQFSMPQLLYVYSFLKHVADEVIGSQLAAKLTNAIKQKASQDEIQVILMEVSDEEHDQQFTPLKVQYHYYIYAYKGRSAL